MKIEIKIIEIKKIENGIEITKKEFIAQFRKEKLIISSETQEWTNDGITKFLTSLAVATPDDECIELSYDKESKDDVYKHICNLFDEFVKEYNSHQK